MKVAELRHHLWHQKKILDAPVLLEVGEYTFDYFSYPPIGAVFKETLTCYADPDNPCEFEVEAEFRLDLVLTAAGST